ncbi:hypothetical protein ACFY1P_03350 [Streptomyces sp. NPDC001407]|uniref:hypothetical protein n=1 Tax=unclassified Streptomyces TaxID=2593676 RepID=UPI0033DD52E5
MAAVLAVMKLLAVLTGALCVGGYVIVGELAVLLVVLAGVGGLTWRVAVASRPRPLGAAGAVRAARPARGRSGVRIGDERDAHVVDDEGRQRQ